MMKALFTIIFTFLITTFTQAQKEIELYKAKEYVGNYTINYQNIQGEGTVFWENNQLVFRADGIANVVLEKGVNEDEFVARRELKIVFQRDNFKKVIGAKLFYQQKEFEVIRKN